ncbi:hypothetical protein MMC07_001675 [Pseudocyphellaria aurata]|nr:hypothetical protein [Pseudocyphellaria aurata]
MSSGEPLLSASFIEPQPILIFPNLQDDVDRRALGLGLMLTGTSVQEGREAWRAYISSYTVAMFAGVLEKLSPSLFKQVKVREEEIRPQLNVLKKCIKDNKVDGNILSRFKLHSCLPAVGNLTGCERVRLEAEPKHLYCHYALVLYLIGRDRIGEEDHLAAEKSFLEVLAGAAKISESALVLSGPARLSEVSHTSINEAWSDLSAPRNVCISEFSKFSSPQTSIGQDLVFLAIQRLEVKRVKTCRTGSTLLVKVSVGLSDSSTP